MTFVTLVVQEEEANHLCSSQDPPGLCLNHNSQAPAKSLEMQRETPPKLGGGRAGPGGRDLHKKTGGGGLRENSLSGRAEDRELERGLRKESGGVLSQASCEGQAFLKIKIEVIGVEEI